MTPRRDDLIDAVLVLAALAAFLVASRQLEVLPPGSAFEWLLVAGVTLAHLVSLGLRVARRDRRPLGATCVLVWLLVLFALPAYFIGLYFAPCALLLTLALYRPRATKATADST